MYIKPSFFIVGERKCGTSSLYRYLIEHPNVLPGEKKEPDLFSKPIWKILPKYNAYKKLFPLKNSTEPAVLQWPELDENGHLFAEEIKYNRKEGVEYITGEATAHTFYYANPLWVRLLLPKVKIVIMFRNPSDRTFSHYKMMARFVREGRRFEPLLPFAAEMQNAMSQVNNNVAHLILSPSIYINKLKSWEKVFGKENIMVIRTEDLNEPDLANEVMESLCFFLGLPSYDFSAILNKRFNQAPSSTMDNDVRQELQSFFRPYNTALEEHLGRSFHWE